VSWGIEACIGSSPARTPSVSLDVMGRAGGNSRRRFPLVATGAVVALAAFAAGAAGMGSQSHSVQLAELGAAGILSGCLAARDTLTRQDTASKKNA
jgi:hypothetical protein